MDKIDIVDILKVIRKKIKTIFIVTIICALLTGFISCYGIEPKYQTFTTIIVGNIQNYNDGIEYDDILLSRELVSTYGELIKSKLVINEVIDNLSLNTVYGKMESKIRVTMIKETEIIKIEVIDKSPILCCEIANEISQVFIKYVKQIMKVNNVQIIDKAEVPVYPITPKPVLNVVLSVICTIVAAVFTVLISEFADNKIKNKEEIEKFLKLSVIGEIPKINIKKKQIGDVKKDNKSKNNLIIVKKYKNSAISEAFKMLRTSIQFLGIDKKINTLLVTSSIEGEGKSTVAANLAISMAQIEKKVLLIDFNLQNPSLYKYFNLENDIGITNLIVEGVEANRVIKYTGIYKLYLISTGPRHINPTEIAQSDKFSAFLEEINKEYDIVIIDSPPASVVTDAGILSKIVDGLIIVCEAGKCSKEVLHDVKGIFTHIKANILGVVLNKENIKTNKYSRY